MKMNMRYALFLEEDGVFVIKEVDSKNICLDVVEDVNITICDNYIKYSWAGKNRIISAIYNGVYRIEY